MRGLRDRDSIDTNRYAVRRHQTVVPANHLERIVERVHHPINHYLVWLDDDIHHGLRPSLPRAVWCFYSTPPLSCAGNDASPTRQHTGFRTVLTRRSNSNDWIGLSSFEVLADLLLELIAVQPSPDVHK